MVRSEIDIERRRETHDIRQLLLKFCSTIFLVLSNIIIIIGYFDYYADTNGCFPGYMTCKNIREYRPYCVNATNNIIATCSLEYFQCNDMCFLRKDVYDSIKNPDYNIGVGIISGGSIMLFLSLLMICSK